MAIAWHVSDLHGHTNRYMKLWQRLRQTPPDVLLLGGDLLPGGSARHASLAPGHQDFIHDFLASGFAQARAKLGRRYPLVLGIMGNDDARFLEAALVSAGAGGLWTVLHQRKLEALGYTFYGYPFVNPTPFQLKDWERWDVSRFVDVGAVPPTAGMRTVPVDPRMVDWHTIERDLAGLASQDDLSRAVFLFHAPPYRSPFDCAPLDGQMIDHAPLDVHVGSVAVARFIEQRQPHITLHGHVHESVRLTGQWHSVTGRTHSFCAAHDGPELAIVAFSLSSPDNATRELL